MEREVQKYEEALGQQVQAARAILGRGLTRETARMFRLGVVVNPSPGFERYNGRLVIPYLAADGHPVGMRFRCLIHEDCKAAGHNAKYLDMDGAELRLFNVKALVDSDSEIHVAEGEFDAMVLTQAGLPAVGVSGCTKWKDSWGDLLAGYSRVWVWSDPDEGGAKMSAHFHRKVRTAGTVHLDPAIGDVTDHYLAGGAALLQERLNAARGLPKDADV